MSAAVTAPTLASAEAGRVGAAAACPPPGVTCQYDVPYGGGSAQTLDVYYPTAPTGEPSIVVIHGGGWRSNDSRTPAAQARYFAENGFAVFSINYTLSTPTAPSWPQVFHDVETATGWVHAHAADYGADRTRLVHSVPRRRPPLRSARHRRSRGRLPNPNRGRHCPARWTSGSPTARAAAARRRTSRNCLAAYRVAARTTRTWTRRRSRTSAPVRPAAVLQQRPRGHPPRRCRGDERRTAGRNVPHALVVIPNSTQHAGAYLCKVVTVLGQQSTRHRRNRPLVREVPGRHTRITPTGTYCSP